MVLEVYYGETGQARKEYYLWEGKLFFVYAADEFYKVPLFHDGFDRDGSRIEEDRYYYHGEKMFRWVDKEGKERDPRSAEFRKKGADLLEEIEGFWGRYERGKTN